MDKGRRERGVGDRGASGTRRGEGEQGCMPSKLSFVHCLAFAMLKKVYTVNLDGP